MMLRQVLTVRELTAYLKNIIEQDLALGNIWVRGEISNFKDHSSGHLYFTLKDEASSLRCIMFRSRRERLVFMPENGMKVLSRGAISVYEREGQYQLYVEELQPDGVGALHLAFEQLKNRLALEGLFDQACKQTIPVLPRKIGIVTSPDGAALKDLLRVIRKRFPPARILLAPSAVQGAGAPAQIARALQLLNRQGDVDVIIVGRGGGSLEELWAFNTEEVARAVFASRIPVISAVGHETDVTIADLVADCRAATPSQAGELAVPVWENLIHDLDQCFLRLEKGLSRKIDFERERLAWLARRPCLTRPGFVLGQQQGQLQDLKRKLKQSLGQYLGREKSVLGLLAGKLDALSPLQILSRGYSICYLYPGDTIVTRADAVSAGNRVEVGLAQGRLLCTVDQVKEETKWG